MVKTVSDTQSTIEWIRLLHWDILRVFKDYCVDVEELQFGLRKIASKPCSWSSSNLEGRVRWEKSQLNCHQKFRELRAYKRFRRLIEKGELIRAQRYQRIFPRFKLESASAGDLDSTDSLLLALKEEFTLAQQELRALMHESSPTDWDRKRAALNVLRSFKRLLKWSDRWHSFDGKTVSQKKNRPNRLRLLERENRAFIVMRLVSKGMKYGTNLDSVTRFCTRWDIIFPIPPAVELPESLDIFTGPFARPIAKFDWDSAANSVSFILTTKLGREIATEFAWGALYSHLPIRSDGGTVSRKPRSGSVTATPINEDQIEVKIVLPINKQTLRTALTTVLPISPLKLKQSSHRLWESMLEVERMRLEGKTWQQIGEEISTGRDPRVAAKARHDRYMKYLVRFFPNARSRPSHS